MNEDILKGQWKQVRGKAREWWGRLSDDDLDKVQGKAERLVGLLQARYGHSREEAEKEIRHRLTCTDTNCVCERH